MKACPSCKAAVAPNARACPQCGHRFPTFLAKLVFWIFAVPLLLAIIYGMVAMSGK